MEMHNIEQLAFFYARARERLGVKVEQLETDMADLKRRRLPAIKGAIKEVAAAQTELKTAIEASPDLFVKPRTTVFHGIKVGYAKQKGKVVVDDEDKTIERIRALLPEEQAELLIRVKESVDRNAVADLSAADLKRLGIRIEETGDVVVIKPVDSEVDRLVATLLKDLDEALGEEAA